MKAEKRYLIFIITAFFILILCDKLAFKLYLHGMSGKSNLLLYNDKIIYILLGAMLDFDKCFFRKPNTRLKVISISFGALIFAIIYMPMVIDTFPLAFSNGFVAPVIAASYFIANPFIIDLCTKAENK